jgi:hypothetical protein
LDVVSPFGRFVAEVGEIKDQSAKGSPRLICGQGFHHAVERIIHFQPVVLISSQPVNRASSKDWIAINPDARIGNLIPRLFQNRSDCDPNELRDRRLLDFVPVLFSRTSLTAATGGRECFAAAINLVRAAFSVSKIASPFTSAVAVRSARRIDFVRIASPWHVISCVLHDLHSAKFFPGFDLLGSVPIPGLAHSARLLTRAQDASYCGISVATFSALCPIRAVTLGKSKRMERFDIVALDLWIDQLGADSASCGRDWLSAMDADYDRGPR